MRFLGESPLSTLNISSIPSILHKKVITVKKNICKTFCHCKTRRRLLFCLFCNIGSIIYIGKSKARDTQGKNEHIYLTQNYIFYNTRTIYTHLNTLYIIYCCIASPNNVVSTEYFSLDELDALVFFTVTSAIDIYADPQKLQTKLGQVYVIKRRSRLPSGFVWNNTFHLWSGV